MSLKSKVFFLIVLPLSLLTLSILRFSGNLSDTTGLLVVLLSGLSGVVVNRFDKKQ
ncbi:hypothetical protein JI666_09460 [Bacillus sp. NTK071]|uniref:hypothetical protein n=1 Tax=Bacillus sp. NTK071 TaxID=2802175 RepID=UPI001A8E7659|nr:hypothetical protein [Bacillus sp. NTK071]MBN8208970.1 hypothetical protein [Bacillus sp. NTK071]